MQFQQQKEKLIKKIKDIITSRDTYQIYSLQKVANRRLNEKIKLVNEVINHIRINNINITNNPPTAAGMWVSSQLGLKSLKIGQKSDPWCKRKIEGDIKLLEDHIII